MSGAPGRRAPAARDGGDAERAAPRWGTLAVVSAATALLLLDVTVVNVALPVVATDLGASFAEVQWVIDAYALALAATLLAAGVLADRHGRRLVLGAGIALFALASVGCAAAGSGTALDLARAAQGVGGAAMFAASLALLADAYRGPDRGVALGVWGAVTGAALALGPLVGGLLVDGPGWRWAFWLNVPLGAALVWATRRLPEAYVPRRRRLDLPGLVTFAGACTLAVLGLVRGNDAGWGSAGVAGCLVASGVLLCAFVAVERRAHDPLLDLRLFRVPAFTGTAVVAFAQSVALYPLLLFLALHLQDVLGFSATGTGLRLLPLTLVLFAVAPLSGRLTTRVPLRAPLVAGLLLVAASLLLLRGQTPSTPWTDLLPGLLVGGLAIGTISPALAAAMVAVLSVERSGLASGINNTFRQLGIAAGVAGLGAIYAARGGTESAAGAVAGLDAVLAVAAAVAVVGAAVAWPLLGALRSPQDA